MPDLLERIPCSPQVATARGILELGNRVCGLQGNCSGPAPTSNTLYPPLASGQCLITVREDFLEVPTQNSQAWISNLYVTLPGVQKNHTTLIGVHGGDLYMTNMTFVADGDKARAVDGGEGTRIYVGRASLEPLLSVCEARCSFTQSALPLP